MTYSEPLINQISSLLTSVGFGFVMCLLYMSVRLLFRLISSNTRSVMAGDAVFSVLASFVSFFFMIISNNGQVRLNLILGQVFGGAVMYLTFGRYAMKYLFKLSDLLRRVILNLLYPVRVYIRALFNMLKSVFTFPGRLLSKKKKKVKVTQEKI